jgi:hypothetical protein
MSNCSHSLVEGMNRFKVGDRVAETEPAREVRLGTVLKIYEFDGESRLVVQFDDSSESVFFGFELTTRWSFSN